MAKQALKGLLFFNAHSFNEFRELNTESAFNIPGQPTQITLTVVLHA